MTFLKYLRSKDLEKVMGDRGRVCVKESLVSWHICQYEVVVAQLFSLMPWNNTKMQPSGLILPKAVHQSVVTWFSLCFDILLINYTIFYSNTY